MTNFARTWAVLAISVLAGVTAACSSPAETPTAVAKPTTSALPSTKAPAGTAPVAAPPTVAVSPTSELVAGNLTYCVPLAALNASGKKVPEGKTGQELALKGMVPMFEPVIAAATADGKTDMATFLSLMKNALADQTQVTKQQGTALVEGMTKFGPVMLKDCGIKFGKR